MTCSVASGAGGHFDRIRCPQLALSGHGERTAHVRFGGKADIACAASLPHLRGGYGPSGNFSLSASGSEFPPSAARIVIRRDGCEYKTRRPRRQTVPSVGAKSSGRDHAAAATAMGSAGPIQTAQAQQQRPASVLTALPSDQIGEVAVSAYLYAYPLISMEMTRRLSTNVADTRQFAKAPMNQFANLPAFPDATYTDIARPNADTLYSLMWFDVSKEPLLINVPNSAGRYYLLPMLDMWTDVFQSTGSRTTGTSAQLLAIAEPRWQGQLPAEAMLVRSPTACGWVIGRTQTNGKADYDAVHKFQAGLITTPLSEWGKSYRPPAGMINPDWDMKTPAVDQVEKLGAAGYFSLFTELTKLNPPHANDYPMLEQMRRMGIEPGKPFAFDKASARSPERIDRSWAARIKENQGKVFAGWRSKRRLAHQPHRSWNLRR